MTQLFTNNAVSLLQTAISETDVTIELQPGLGSAFPQPNNPGDYFLITLESIAAPLHREIIKISERNGDILTVANMGRAQEGTIAQHWPATNTLVDHRVTAETMRQAFLHPLPTSAGAGGYEYPSIIISALNQQTIATVNYSHEHRGNKFWVSMVSPENYFAQNFEVLSIIQGNLMTNSETVSWTKTNRIGYNFSGDIILSLDTATKELNLQWNNQETVNTIVVSVTRI